MFAQVQGVAVRVWDLPTRLAHWLIVLLTIVSWLTAQNDWIVWHKASGYSMLCVVMFRIYWGFRGSTSARFASFVRGPRTVLRYVSDFLFGGSGHAPAIGHNPLGGWSALMLLIALLLQACLGLFAVDEYGTESGALAAYVSFETGRQITELHGAVFDVLLLLIGVHVVAILVHLVFKRENLIAAMLTGVKRNVRGSIPSLAFVGPAHAACALLACALIVVLLVSVG